MSGVSYWSYFTLHVSFSLLTIFVATLCLVANQVSGLHSQEKRLPHKDEVILPSCKPEYWNSL